MAGVSAVESVPLAGSVGSADSFGLVAHASAANSGALRSTLEISRAAFSHEAALSHMFVIPGCQRSSARSTAGRLGSAVLKSPSFSKSFAAAS
jgi:hypothetical protein